VVSREGYHLFLLCELPGTQGSHIVKEEGSVVGPGALLELVPDLIHRLLHIEVVEIGAVGAIKVDGSKVCRVEIGLV